MYSVEHVILMCKPCPCEHCLPNSGIGASVAGSSLRLLGGRRYAVALLSFFVLPSLCIFADNRPPLLIVLLLPLSLTITLTRTTVLMLPTSFALIFFTFASLDRSRGTFGLDPDLDWNRLSRTGNRPELAKGFRLPLHIAQLQMQW